MPVGSRIAVSEEVHPLRHHGTDGAVDLEVGRHPLAHEHLVRSAVVSHNIEGEHAVVVRSHMEGEVRCAELHRSDRGGDDEADRLVHRRHQHQDAPPDRVVTGQKRTHRARICNGHRVTNNGNDCGNGRETVSGHEASWGERCRGVRTEKGIILPNFNQKRGRTRPLHSRYAVAVACIMARIFWR